MTAALRAQIPIPPAPGMSNASRWHLLGKSTAAWGLQLESLLVEQQVPGVAGGCSLHLRGAQPQSKSLPYGWGWSNPVTWLVLERCSSHLSTVTARRCACWPALFNWQRPQSRGAFHILMMKIGKARHGEMESLTHSRWSQDLMQALTPQCLITFLWASKVFS